MFSISKRVSLSNWNIKSNVGVRNLNATHEKYLFRSLYTRLPTEIDDVGEIPEPTRVSGIFYCNIQSENK